MSALSGHTAPKSAAGPRRIARLDEAVVNKIAAGEVVHRPASALKEILENSLDAGSTAISVISKGGGLQLLQITDNGCGIHKDDFSLVCERFATSKLKTYEDLERISSYGFRGEALASICHVARVTITSMTTGSPCAYRATFANGVMCSEVKPCAGVRGTVITVEDMFADNPARRAAFKNAGEEYNHITDVVERYAIQHSHRGVTFTCKKHGEMAPDVYVAGGTPAPAAIGAVFGNTVKRELLSFDLTYPTTTSTSASASVGVTTAYMDGAEALSFIARGQISNANFNSKKALFVLFINERLVDCGHLKKAIEGAYADMLPKHTHPFVYLSITIPPERIDVNVHPTKREVHFLYQDELIAEVVGAVKARLHGGNASRTFYTQSLLPLPSLTSAGTSTTSAGPTSMHILRGTGIHAEPAVQVAPATLDDQYNTLAAQLGGAVDDADAGSKHRTAAARDSVGTHAAAAATTTTTTTSTASSAGAGTGRAGVTAKANAPHKTVRVDVGSGSMRQFLVSTSDHTEGGVGGSSESARGEPSSGTDAAHTGSSTSTQQRTGTGPHAHTGTPVDACGCDSSHTHSRGHGVGGDAIGDDETSTQHQHQASTARTPHAARSARPSHPLLPITLTSVLELLGEVERQQHEGLGALIKRHVFVGVVNAHLSLLQYDTKLLLVNHVQWARELFYQRALRLFGNATTFELHPTPSVATLAALGLAARRGESAESPDIRELGGEVAELLASKAEMLDDYFGIGVEVRAHAAKRPRRGTDPVGSSSSSSSSSGVDDSGEQDEALASSLSARSGIIGSQIVLTHLPRLVDGHVPFLLHLPDFILSLAYDVKWETEKECFHTIAQVVGKYYADTPPPCPPKDTGGGRRTTTTSGRFTLHSRDHSYGLAPGDETMDAGGVGVVNVDADEDTAIPATALVAEDVDSEALRGQSESIHWQVASVLFPAMRRDFSPPRKLAADHYAIQVASTEQLYRIFERC